MGEKFRVRWTGVSRNLPHAGEAIREPAVMFSGEEKRPWRNGKKAWLRLQSLGQTGSEEKRLRPTRCSGAASEGGGGTVRLSRGWHLSPLSSLSSDGQGRGDLTHSPRQLSHTNQPHIGVEMSQFPGYLLSWRYHHLPSALSPLCQALAFPCTMNGYSINKRLSLL